MKAALVLVLASTGLVATSFATTDAAAVAALRLRAASLFGTVQPVTAAEVAAPQAALGRALFWDTRLSSNGKTACVSCHLPADHGADRRPLSITAKGEPTTLQSQVIFMAMDQSALRWYGDRTDGAHQAERSITGSLGFDTTKAVIPVLKELGYDGLFRAAYPSANDPVTTANYAQALMAYQRTLRTPAPFDAFLAGNDQALDSRQLAGLDKFVVYGCVGCHNGALLGGNSFQKFGLVKDYWLATGSKKIDAGRVSFTNKEEDRYVFRVPMLRNIAMTAPYFHDGSVATLDDAVRVMAEVQLGRKAPDADVADIVAFLGSLTGLIPSHYAAPP